MPLEAGLRSDLSKQRRGDFVEGSIDEIRSRIRRRAEERFGDSEAVSRTWKLTLQAEAALDEIIVYSAQEGRFDVAETIAYLIDPILERIEALAVDGTWGAKSCDRILGEGRSAGGLKYVVMEKSGYLIIFDEFDDRIEVIDIVYGGRDLPAYLNERIYALDRTSPTERASQSKKRQSRGRHTKTDDQNDH